MRCSRCLGKLLSCLRLSQGQKPTDFVTTSRQASSSDASVSSCGRFEHARCLEFDQKITKDVRQGWPFMVYQCQWWNKDEA
jgi:hypothetical protein